MIGRATRAELEPRLGPDGWQAALEEARAELRAQLVDGAVRFVASAFDVRDDVASSPILRRGRSAYERWLDSYWRLLTKTVLAR